MIRLKGAACSFHKWMPGATGVARPVPSLPGGVPRSTSMVLPSVRFNGTVRAYGSDAPARAVEAIRQGMASA